MKKGLKLALALVLVVATIAFAACSVDFAKAFNADNFKDVTMKIEVTVSDELKDTEFDDTGIMTIKVTGNKALATITSGTGDDAFAIESYVEKQASGSKYDSWVKMTTGTGTTATSAYSKSEMEADKFEEGKRMPEFKDFKKEDFEEKDGYFVLKADKKKAYAEVVDLAKDSENYELKLKFASNKLTEMIIEETVAKAEISSTAAKDGVITTKTTFSDYGKTTVTKPSWINDTNFPAA